MILRDVVVICAVHKLSDSLLPRHMVRLQLPVSSVAMSLALANEM